MTAEKRSESISTTAVEPAGDQGAPVESFSKKMAFSFAINVAVPVVSLATAPILAQSLGVEGRGLVAAAVAPLLFVVAVGALGIPDAIIYFVAKHAGSARQIVFRAAALLLVLGLACAVGVWVLAVPLAAGNADLEQLIMFTAIATPLNFLSNVPRGLALGSHRWKLAATVMTISAAIRLAAYLTLWLGGWLTPLLAVVIILAMPVLESLCYLPFVFRRLGKAEVHEKNPGLGLAAISSFGGRLWFGSLAGVILSRMDQLLMVPLSNAKQLGLYVVAVSVGEAPGVIASAVRGVILPSDAAEHGSPHAVERLQRAARITSFLTLLSSLALGASCWWWLPLLFGADFSAALPATLVLLLASSLGAAGSVGGAGLSARNRPGLRSLSMGIAAALNLVVFLLLVGPLGALGAAISTLVGNFVAGNLNLIWLSRRFGMPLGGFYGIRLSDLDVLWYSAKKVLRRAPARRA